jgi:hypothetical protein
LYQSKEHLEWIKQKRHLELQSLRHIINFERKLISDEDFNECERALKNCKTQKDFTSILVQHLKRLGYECSPVGFSPEQIQILYEILIKYTKDDSSDIQNNDRILNLLVCLCNSPWDLTCHSHFSHALSFYANDGEIPGTSQYNIFNFSFLILIFLHLPPL